MFDVHCALSLTLEGCFHIMLSPRIGCGSDAGIHLIASVFKYTIADSWSCFLTQMFTDGAHRATDNSETHMKREFQSYQTFLEISLCFLLTSV